MKVEEAIERIRDHFRVHDDGRPTPYLDEAVYMAIMALEKQIPMKPVYSDYDDNGDDEIIPNEAKCPVCGHEFEFGTWNEWDTPYCVCGQKMDWNE